MRRWLLIAGLVGCGGGTGTVCCDLGDAHDLLTPEACAEAGGSRSPRYLCAGVDDADGPPDTDLTLPDDPTARCELFCTLEMALCPEDDACMHSCTTSTTPPEQEHVDCVAAATTCEETFPCWGFQTFD